MNLADSDSGTGNYLIMNGTALSANTLGFLVALYIMVVLIRVHDAYVNLHHVDTSSESTERLVLL